LQIEGGVQWPAGINKPDPLPALLQAFSYEWLVQQRNASGHTVRSDRDTLRLFLRLVSQRHNRTVPQLRLEDLTGSEVAAFLQYTEQERGDSIGTRNCRLAALRSFFGFVAGREPDRAEQCAEVSRHSDQEGAGARSVLSGPAGGGSHLAQQPYRSTLEGQRDHALLSFLYNTGARIQEALAVGDNPARYRVARKLEDPFE